jgi:arylsulfatase A-like enzyme
LIVTGRYGFRAGWYNFTGRSGSPTRENPDYDLGKAETTFAHILKQQGYATGLAGPWLEWGNEHLQIPHAGFDEYLILLFYPMILVHDPHDPAPDLQQPGQKRVGNMQSLVKYMDHLVGLLLMELDESGARQNTVVIFAGDNGPSKAGKSTATEYGARVPFIVSGPARSARR